MAQAVTESYYVVAAVALLVAVFVLVGLQDLKGEEGKGWKTLLGLRRRRPEDSEPAGSDGPSRQVRIMSSHWMDVEF
jgi:hypothetical protein